MHIGAWWFCNQMKQALQCSDTYCCKHPGTACTHSVRVKDRKMSQSYLNTKGFRWNKTQCTSPANSHFLPIPWWQRPMAKSVLWHLLWNAHLSALGEFVLVHLWQSSRVNMSPVTETQSICVEALDANQSLPWANVGCYCWHSVDAPRGKSKHIYCVWNSAGCNF